MAAGAAAGVAGAAVDGFVTLAVSIYLLSSKELLLHAARTCLRAALPPQKVGGLFSVCTMANRTFSGYIGGQLVDALLVGVETFLLMSLFRLDYAPLIAVLVGVTNIIPLLGPFIGAAPGALILLLESPLQALEFVIIILVVQQVDGNFIAPRILGGATGMPGLGVLLAIIVGGNLFGVPGHGGGCAHAGRAGHPAQAGGGRRTGGPGDRRGRPPAAAAPRPEKLTTFVLRPPRRPLTIEGARKQGTS